MTQDEADAYTLRAAAGIMRRRGPDPAPFTLRVVIRVLQRMADRIEGHGHTVDG